MNNNNNNNNKKPQQEQEQEQQQQQQQRRRRRQQPNEHIKKKQDLDTHLGLELSAAEETDDKTQTYCKDFVTINVNKLILIRILKVW